MSRKLENAVSLYLHGIRDGHYREAIAEYAGERFTEHSTGVKDGHDGFIEFFEDFMRRNPVRDIRIIRGLEDGRYVFLHAYQSLNNGESEWVTTDFFDTDEHDRIVEHWDVIAAYVPATPTGTSSIDGPTEIVDMERTQDNKLVVRSLISESLIGNDAHCLDRHIAMEQYVEHSAGVSGGVTWLDALVSSGTAAIAYDEIVLLVGQGDLVATLCKTRRAGVPWAQVDIFRLENSVIVEHWDNAEPVPSAAESVNSGKF
jgi:predicted SnoaL-like aldol condensation-catalyzing enzyme